MDGELQSRGIERLNPEQQTEVLRLAARLQAEDADHMSPEQLAAIAAEAGIDERFVHEALARISAAKVEVPEARTAAEEVADGPFQRAAMLFFIAQIWAGFVAVNADLFMIGVKGYPLIVTGLLSLLFGLRSKDVPNGLRRGFRWILLTAAFSLAIAGLFHSAFIGFPLNAYWIRWACAGIGVQAVSFLLGRFIGQGERASRRSDRKPQLSAKR
jgi:hypothetical protein